MDVTAGDKPEEALSYVIAIDEKTDERPPSYKQVNEIALGLPNLNFGETHSDSLPVSPDQCVAHLKFLAVLEDLRWRVSNKNGIFGIYDSEAERFPASTNEALVRIREKRWAVYTARAVERYTKWWFDLLPISRPQVTMRDLENPEYERSIIDCDTRILWTADNVPPLDILMIWHSHMLHPRDFLEDCIRYGKLSAWSTGFPFEAVNNCIDNRMLEYKPSEACQQAFERHIKLRWDNLDDSPSKELACPRCSKPNEVPWTKGGIGHSLKEAFKKNTGIADASFKTRCNNCRFTINHSRLMVAKFRQDVSDLLTANHPMPGSICNIDGIPQGRQNVRNPQYWNNMTFPSRLVQAVGNDMLIFTDPCGNWCKNIDDLRTQMEVTVRDRNALTAAKGKFQSLSPGEREHFRRMMSHYWGNTSYFALDLVGAVIGQGTFIQNMVNIDWLHSPTVMETSRRLTKKYKIFIDIKLENPLKTAVPTMDVGLAWLTHQLQPRKYYKYTTKGVCRGCRQLIDHDYTPRECNISESFEWTSEMYYRATNGGIYSECSCWYCEAKRAPGP